MPAVAALAFRTVGGRAVAVTAMTAALVAGLAGPAAYAVSTASGGTGGGTSPTAGPSVAGGGLITYLENDQGSASWLPAVSSAQTAASIELQAGRAVIAMGGFTGGDPAMTVAKLQAYVKEGQPTDVLVGDDNRGGSGSPAVTTWIKQHGTAVNASEYGGTSGSGTLGKLG